MNDVVDPYYHFCRLQRQEWVACPEGTGGATMGRMRFVETSRSNR